MKKTKEEYYQANPLVQARRNYDILEHRILRLAIANLNPKLKNSQYHDEQFPSFHLSTDEVFAQFQSNDKNDHRIYKKIHSACVNMMKSYIQIGDVKNFTLFPVFHRIKFTVAEGLTIQFHEDMKPFLLNFESGNYTRCYLQLAFELSSKYSLILLELMLQYRGTQKHNIIERRITPEELKFALDVDDNAYQGRINNFKLKVINPAIKEINEQTNYYICPDYKTEYGRWRKIKAFVFTMILPNADEECQPKTKPKKEDISAIDDATVEKATSFDVAPAKPSPTENHPVKTEETEEFEPIKPKKKLNDYTNDELKILKKLLEIKLNKDTALELVDECGIKAIEKAFKEMNQTRQKGRLIDNPAGFIRYKTYEYFNSENDITEEDILNRVAEIEENERQERIRLSEEAEQKKAEADAKEAKRKANRKPWKEWEIKILAENYLKNGNTFIEADKKAIKERGWKPQELLNVKEYMQYFYPYSSVLTEISKKAPKENDFK